MHACAHMSQARAHIALISAASGDLRIIMSAHIRVISLQSMSARMICIRSWPPLPMDMQELMVSSHMVWHDMHAATQSCIALLIGAMVPVWVMMPPRGRRRPRRPPLRLRPTPARRLAPSQIRAVQDMTGMDIRDEGDP
jgi:predicted small integral membrane protein